MKILEKYQVIGAQGEYIDMAVVEDGGHTIILQADQVEDECHCVLPEQVCPVCAGKHDPEEPLPF